MTFEDELRPWRCQNCRRILARVSLTPGCVIEVKCGCNQVNIREVVYSTFVCVTRDVELKEIK